MKRTKVALLSFTGTGVLVCRDYLKTRHFTYCNTSIPTSIFIDIWTCSWIPLMLQRRVKFLSVSFQEFSPSFAASPRVIPCLPRASRRTVWEPLC